MDASTGGTCGHLIALDLEAIRDELLIAVDVHVCSNSSGRQNACRHCVCEVIVERIHFFCDDDSFPRINLILCSEGIPHSRLPINDSVSCNSNAPSRGNARVGAAGSSGVVRHKHWAAYHGVLLHGKTSSGVHGPTRDARRRSLRRDRKVGVHHSAEEEFPLDFNILSKDCALLHAHPTVDFQGSLVEGSGIGEVLQVHWAINRRSFDNIHTVKDRENTSDICVSRDSCGTTNDGILLYNDSLWRSDCQSFLRVYWALCENPPRSFQRQVCHIKDLNSSASSH